MELVKLSDISADNDLEPRALITSDVVDEYAEAMRRGESFPPVTLFKDGTTYWLADGYHRYRAAKQAGLERVSAEFRSGTKLDALKFALGANATHGLRRSQTDKRRAVLIALRQFGDLSNREISRLVAVDDKTVGKYRSRLAVVDEIKPRIANGESFLAMRGKDYDNLLFIVKLAGPCVRMAYAVFDKGEWDYVSQRRGVHQKYMECATCLMTHGLGLTDFEFWEPVDADTLDKIERGES